MIDNGEDETINRFIKGLLRNKIQPNQLPKKLIPKINTALDNEKTIAINKGSIAKVKQIHQIKSDILRAEQIRNVATSRSPLPSLYRRNNNAKTYSSEFIEETLQGLVDGKPFDRNKSNTIPDLINLTKEKINQLVDENQFPEAQLYEDILQKLFVISNEVNIERKHNKRKENVERMLREAEEDLEGAKNVYEQSLNDFDQDAKDSIEEITNKFKEQLDKFDQETEKGPLPKYFKMSKQYLILRETQKALVSAKKYEEAANVKAQADKLEKKERKDLTDKFYNEREIARKNLCNDYYTNLKCLEDQINRKKTRLVVDNETYIKNKQKSIDNIKGKFIYTQNIMKKNDLNSTMSKSLISQTSAKVSQRSRANSSFSPSMPSKSDQSNKVSVSTQTVKRFNFATIKPLD